jgi:hypothetical protein
MKYLAPTVVGMSLLTAISSQAIPVTVQEVSVSPTEVVSITSSTLGTASVYAGVVNLLVDGVATPSVCIDPFHWSLSGPQPYDSEPLSTGPKPPGGPMGTAAATEIEQLWGQYFSPTMSASDAAGLQIAIWEIVGGANFTLNQANDYGAGSMLAWWSQNQATAPLANLLAVTGPGQDYVIRDSGGVIPNSGGGGDPVPESGTTILLLGGTLCGLLAVRRKLCVSASP